MVSKCRKKDGVRILIVLAAFDDSSSSSPSASPTVQQQITPIRYDQAQLASFAVNLTCLGGKKDGSDGGHSTLER